MSTTCWVHPDAPRHWGSCYVHHVRAQVAFVNVLIVGVSNNGRITEAHTECIQQFIDSQGWKGRAIWDFHGHKFNNAIRQGNGCVLRLLAGTNGLHEHTGTSATHIVWEWSQVIEWLSTHWPSRGGVVGTADSAVGTWCYMDGFTGNDDHIERDEHMGWPVAMRQMRSIGIPKDVRDLRRKLDEYESVEALCASLKKHRVKLDKLHT